MSEEIVRPGFNFIWAIENFSHALQKKGESIESPVFKTTVSDEIEWHLSLYPRGHEANLGTQQSISIFLAIENRNNGRIEISTEFEISLISDNGENLQSFYTKCTYTKVVGLGWRTFIPRQVVLMVRRSEFLPKDTLTVCCRIPSINSKSVENGSLYALSRIGVQKTSAIWSIENFSKLQPKTKAYILLKSVSTQMDLYFLDEVQDCCEMQLDISQVDISKRSLSTCKISLLDVNGKTVDSKDDEHFFDASKNECWKFPQFITRNMLLSNRDRYLPRDILTLRCEFSLSFGLIENKIENYGNCLSQIVKSDYTSFLDNLHISKEIDKCHILTEDLRQLYKDQTHSDMSVVVEDITFPVHKNILSARSSVFRAILDLDIVVKTGVVNIPDLDQDTVRRMLSFLYTDTVEDLQCKDCMDLYVAADRYNIQYLKEKCNFLLRSIVNLSNVVDVLIFADKRSDRILKNYLQHFMKGREKDIFSSEEWKRLMKDNLPLAAEVMHEFCLHK